MRSKILLIFCFVFLLSGCSGDTGPLDKALSLRDSIISSEGCSFHTQITADYGEKIYIFGMDCKTDRDGNLYFTVTEPATISGITGKITGDGGAITFDDKVLAFRTMADGLISPVSAPWVFIRSLCGGYMKDCTGEEHNYIISVDDCYEEDALQLRIQVDADKPVAGEIFWQGRRVLVLTVEEFVVL